MKNKHFLCIVILSLLLAFVFEENRKIEHLSNSDDAKCPASCLKQSNSSAELLISIANIKTDVKKNQTNFTKLQSQLKTIQSQQTKNTAQLKALAAKEAKLKAQLKSSGFKT